MSRERYARRNGEAARRSFGLRVEHVEQLHELISNGPIGPQNLERLGQVAKLVATSEQSEGEHREEHTLPRLSANRRGPVRRKNASVVGHALRIVQMLEPVHRTEQ